MQAVIFVNDLGDINSLSFVKIGIKCEKNTIFIKRPRRGHTISNSSVVEPYWRATCG